MKTAHSVETSVNLFCTQ